MVVLESLAGRVPACLLLIKYTKRRFARFSALPVDMSGTDIPSPLTPQLRSPKQMHTIIRRASTIKGLAFTADDFEMGPYIGTGFFGKVRKVGLW